MKKLMFAFLFVISFCKADSSSWEEAVWPIGAVHKLENIKTLNLAGASIIELPENPYLPNVKRLYLKKNKISYVNPEGFRRFLEKLPKLEVLDLRQNQLSKENADELSNVAAEIKAETGQDIHIITDDVW